MAIQNIKKQNFSGKSGSSRLKIWLVTVDMGYGHQRASYPLRNIAYRGLINANNYSGIPKKDREIWQNQRRLYEAISRFKSFPVLGNWIFEIFDRIQEIPKFYPKRDLSRPSLQILSASHLIKHNHWGRHLIEKLSKNPLPFVTSFFATAIMAEIHNYPGEIYCVICDADISRAWVAAEPSESRIKYFAPNTRVAERLQLYGVPKSRVFLTGFPLPDENLGYPDFKILREDLKQRLLNLDPNHKYIDKYKETLLKNLKIKNFPKKSNHPLTITFAVGGAGAQRELGAEIIKQLSSKIKNKKLKLNLIAGVHHNVNKYFLEAVKKNHLKNNLGAEVEILFERNKETYFKKFNQLLRKTDILWTKPSELSFYSALGLPIIIAPPIGSQEEFNRRWLINLGAGINQEDPRYVAQWLDDAIKSGWLAEASSQGFLEAPRMGIYNIKKILAKQLGQTEKMKTISPY